MTTATFTGNGLLVVPALLLLTGVIEDRNVHSHKLMSS
jgi:hypothetical protein